MKMRRDEEVFVTFDDFKLELINECEYLSECGTFYRSQTAEYALEVVDHVEDYYSFLNVENAFQLVQQLLSHLDVDRLKDIAKMISVILNDLHAKANYSNEFKTLLFERVKNRNYRMTLE